jgi:hypothetical protein
MVLAILLFVSLILTFLFIITISFMLGEKVQVFLIRTLSSEDEIYQMYNLAMFTILFFTMFIASAATYNTFIK